MKSRKNSFFRRVVALALCGVVVLLGACSQAEALRLSAVAPWKYNNGHAELVRYDVVRRQGNDVVASGEYLTEIRLDIPSNLFVLTSSLSLVYDQNRTDTITAMSVFTPALKAVYAKKQRVINGTISYAGFYELTSEDNYDFEAVYSDFTLGGKSYTKGATGNFKRMSDEPIEFDMAHSDSGTYCDNEYLFYFVRSVFGLAPDYNNSFAHYDIFAAFTKSSPSLSRTTLLLAVDNAVKDFDINPSLVSEVGTGELFKADFDEDDAEKVTVKALTARIRRQSANTGTDLVLYYSLPDATHTSLDTFANNRKVLLGMESTETNPTTAEVLYTNIYTISQYAVNYN